MPDLRNDSGIRAGVSLLGGSKCSEAQYVRGQVNCPTEVPRSEKRRHRVVLAYTLRLRRYVSRT
jgi:hypothetical protein